MHVCLVNWLHFLRTRLHYRGGNSGGDGSGSSSSSSSSSSYQTSDRRLKRIFLFEQISVVLNKQKYSGVSVCRSEQRVMVTPWVENRSGNRTPAVGMSRSCFGQAYENQTTPSELSCLQIMTETQTSDKSS